MTNIPTTAAQPAQRGGDPSRSGGQPHGPGGASSGRGDSGISPATGASSSRPARLTGYRHVTDMAFTVLMTIFVVGVLAQVLLAGLGIFSRGSGGPGFGPHEDLGNVLSIVTAVLLVLALVAHVSWRIVVCVLVLEVLTEVVQHALAQAGWNHAWLGALHALDGVLILLLAAGLAVTSLARVTGKSVLGHR